MIDREKVISELNDCLENQHISFMDGVGNIYAVSEETIRNVLSLLKEQETMQPKNIWHTIDHTSNGDCPKCGCEVNQFDNSMLCGRCGQLLDWKNL